MLYVDIPTLPELQKLVAARNTPSVSLYVPTTPQTDAIDAARTRIGQLFKKAEAQLAEADTAKRTVWPLQEQIDDLLDDDDFWAHQANSLAIFLTPDTMQTFRLPTHLTESVQVADRFFLKPLIRAVSVPQHAFVLALEENGVRLVEVTGDLPAAEVRVPALPKDAATANRTASVNSRSPSGRIQGGEGQKLLLRNYARQIDAALRPVLSGRSEPLILAATDPLLSIYRSVNSYSHLAPAAIETSPARVTPADLSARARPILDALHADTVAEFHKLYSARENEGRATTQIARAARAATFGAVDTLLVDIDEVVHGTVDDQSGEITFADAPGVGTYGVVDEIAGRVLSSGGRVLGVRRDEIPEKAELAAVLRYAI